MTCSLHERFSHDQLSIGVNWEDSGSANNHKPIGGGSMPSRGGGTALAAFVLVALPSMTAPAPSSLLVSLDFVPGLGSLIIIISAC